MVSLRLKITFVLLFIMNCPLFALGATLNDTLNLSFDQLFERIESCSDISTRNYFLKEFIQKAKNENNREELTNGYKNFIFYSDDKNKIIYADSMVTSALKSGDSKLIGASYLTKGITYYGLKEHRKALGNYLIADKYISKIEDDYLKHKLLYNLAHVKYYLNQTDDAIPLFLNCLDYFKTQNTRAYLNTLHSLGLCYIKEGNYGASIAISNQGLNEGKRLNNHKMDAYFLHLKGLNNYFLNNFTTAINTLKSSISEIQRNHDLGNLTVAYFYIGRSFWALRKYDEALPYLKKVDTAFIKQNYIREDLRENYELLIHYYKKKNEPEKVLRYVENLLKADSVLLQTHDNLSSRIYKEFDTPTLQKEKKNIEKQLLIEHQQNTILVLVTIFLLLGTLTLLYRHQHYKRINKKRFEALMLQSPHEKITKQVSPPTSDINPETFQNLLKQLEKWEKQKKYLDKNISLTSLANTLGSNTRYISTLITTTRNKKFSDYINDLKVEYIINELKNDKLKRNYTNDALAEEAGFTSTQRFVTAFKSKTKLSPTFFTEQLKKEAKLNPLKS